MSRYYAYIVAYISRLEIGNVVLRPARLEVGHYDSIFADTNTVYSSTRLYSCALPRANMASYSNRRKYLCVVAVVQ